MGEGLFAWHPEWIRTRSNDDFFGLKKKTHLPFPIHQPDLRHHRPSLLHDQRL